MKATCTMPSANGIDAVKIEKILDEELGTNIDNPQGAEDLVFMALIVNT